ncbi:hypothetical protein HN587_07180 [Candidatus Woesearchaeota archaeon]|jgi:hypothetical protein|nr:hypothetical protein [Candidatus Woesearchaeota archaeon]
MNELAQFKNASTFSHIGRNAAGIQFLIQSLNKAPNHTLEVGSGCIEPVYVSHLLPEQSDLYSVDVNGQIISALAHLSSGERVNLASLEKLVCNKQADGTPRPNSDLTDPKIIEIGLRELEFAGLDPSRFFQNNEYLLPPGGARIIPVCSDLETYAKQTPQLFDLVYAGVVLLNIAKTVDSRDQLVELVASLISAVKEGGVLGIGTTPAALYGEKSTPGLLESAGGTITDIYIDSLVRAKIGSGYKVFGGHMIRTVPCDQPGLSRVDETEIDERLSRSPVFQGVGIIKEVYSNDVLNGYLETQSKSRTHMLLATMRTVRGYVVWSAKKDSFVEQIPLQRTQIGIIPGLEYKAK